MDIVKEYGRHIKECAADRPRRAAAMIRLGLREEILRHRFLPEKGMPKAYAHLSRMALQSVLDAMARPESSVWTNIFAPVELLQCFGLQSISMECMSSVLSGFMIEDQLIDQAENTGIAPTLCSYHKSFMGAVDLGVAPKAPLSVTTSMICDGNINTFRYLEQKHGVPSFVIDVPNEDSPGARHYIAIQLQELTERLQALTGRRLDKDALRETLERENESHRLYRSFLQKQRHKYYPSTLTTHLFMLFATHLNIGSPETLQFFRELDAEIDACPEFTGKGIFWVHLLPYYQPTLQKYFNYNEKYYIQACDLNMDFMQPLDIADPFDALAGKMLQNLYNGSYQRKAQRVTQLAQEFGSDAVIHFCHWGCKQSAGGVMLLKDSLRAAGLPMLALDGDAMDRRNSHDGQIKTRLEAFLELLENGGEEKSA